MGENFQNFQSLGDLKRVTAVAHNGNGYRRSRVGTSVLSRHRFPVSIVQQVVLPDACYILILCCAWSCKKSGGKAERQYEPSRCRIPDHLGKSLQRYYRCLFYARFIHGAALHV